jgi:acyl dehydratase
LQIHADDVIRECHPDLAAFAEALQHGSLVIAHGLRLMSAVGALIVSSSSSISKNLIPGFIEGTARVFSATSLTHSRTVRSEGGRAQKKAAVLYI